MQVLSFKELKSLFKFLVLELPINLFLMGLDFVKQLPLHLYQSFFTKVDFRDKVIWITGASQGIGKEFAIKISKQNPKLLILSSRNETELVNVKYSCKNPENIQILPMDMSKINQVRETTQNFTAQLEQKGVFINMIILNAGLTMRSLFEDFDLDNHEYMTNVNYLAPTIQVHSLIPHFKKNNGGQIVVINSILGKMTQPLRSSYCASKYALVGFFDVLRSEIYPGLTQTNVQKNALVSEKGKKYGKSDQSLLTGMPVDEFVDRSLVAIYHKYNDQIISSKWIHYFIMSAKNIWPDYFNKQQQKQLAEQIRIKETTQ